MLFESGLLGLLHQLASVCVLLLAFLTFGFTLSIDGCFLLLSACLFHRLSALSGFAALVLAFLLSLLTPLNDLHLCDDPISVVDASLSQGSLMITLFFGLLDRFQVFFVLFLCFDVPL